METLSFLLSILIVAVGLGFVIFFHELGHFVLAKWNGVKVEVFSIGFGPALVQFRRGETVYKLSAVPLGGYVKMLGEEPESEATKTSDPRAFHNKPVGARMAIIAAGVIMNLILGFVCFMVAYLWGGLNVPSPKVGRVVAGSPSYVSGLRVGDEIVSINGRQDVSFKDLVLTVALSGNDDVVHLEVKRPGRDSLVPVDVVPRREPGGDKPTIGAWFPDDLELREKPIKPFIVPAGMVPKPKDPSLGFHANDKVVRVGPTGGVSEAVADILGLHRILAKYRDKPIDFVVERSETSEGRLDSSKTLVTLSVPPVHFVDFGFRPVMDPIVTIQKGSPAEEAGFHVGDRIVKVDGKADFDLIWLPEYAFDHAGQPVTFVVERTEPGKSPTAVTLTARPDATPPRDVFPPWLAPFGNHEPLEVPGLGLAYPALPKVASVVAGSPAAKSGLKPGDVLRSMTVALPNPAEEGWTDKTFNFFGEDGIGWPTAFNQIQTLPRQAIKLTIANSKQPIVLTPEAVGDRFFPHRGLQFRELRNPMPRQSLSNAVGYAGRDTLDNVTQLPKLVRSILFEKRMSASKTFSGPIGIAGFAWESAKQGFASFVLFLGMLNISLAVLNFLPIPPLDGGQMIFLIAEKVRGRPLPENAQMPLVILGVVLLLSLMLFVSYQDVMNLLT